MTARLRSLLCASAVLLFASTASANDITRPAAAPRTLVYTVKPGDTLIDLANAYLINPSDYRQIQQLNQIREPRRLQIGRTLNLPVSLLRATSVQAQVSSFRGQVTLDSDSGARAPTANQPVSEGTLITTGANAFLRLALTDGSFVVVPSNSRVRLTRLRRYLINGAVDHDLEVQRGRLESRVSPRQFPGGYRVTTPVSVSAVRGTEFRISLNDASNRAATEVLEGHVEVERTGTDDLAAATADQAIAVSAAGLLLAPLPPAPSLTDPAAILTKPEVGLTVTAQAGAVAYRGRLATDAGMIEAFAETDTAQGSNILNFGPLDDGLYYLRITAISPEGIEGRGTIYNLVRIQNQVANMAAQALGDPRQRAYRFRWEAGGSPTGAEDRDYRYRFVLHRQNEEGDPMGPAILDRMALTAPNVSLTGLDNGIYSWRVQITQTRFGRTVDTWSEPQTLRIGL